MTKAISQSLKSYGQNVKECSFFVFSTKNDSKNSVTVWAKCLSASEICYLAFLENTMDY